MLKRVAILCVICLLSVSNVRGQNESAGFAKLLEDAWDFDMRENPLRATRNGDRRFDGKLR